MGSGSCHGELHEQALESQNPDTDVHRLRQSNISSRISEAVFAGELAPELIYCVNLGVQGDGGGLRQNHFLESRIFLHMSNCPAER